MSYCRQEGKDRVIFVTKEDHEEPSQAKLKEDEPDPYDEQGLILPSGEINWNCPCLGGMASGPCGDAFKSAFSCFHNSKEEMRGADCIDHFRDMQECMQRYPEIYPQDDDPTTALTNDDLDIPVAPEGSADRHENAPEGGQGGEPATSESPAMSEVSESGHGEVAAATVTDRATTVGQS
ncbi:mitochondrial intermembrane space import and assembly protein 40 [Petromyzon marinus]|uniref:Mitochondrial intermembrane space import and assembly protein 40 n=1 Tax=Petromyzon marinus TaxID=7757 RepID=A0AAJ7TM30_PETMA|nr:mitochondrial intermembrane space import and assembly protein 40 [Petromyzon marinus]